MDAVLLFVLLAATGGALVAWGFVILAQADERCLRIGAARILQRAATRTLFAQNMTQRLILPCWYLTLFLFVSVSGAVAGEKEQCGSSGELQCIKSPVCTLVHVKDHNYRCRAAAGKCEVGFIQWGDKQVESCETKTGCKYIPGSCYCPPDVLCRCSGGKPPHCEESR